MAVTRRELFRLGRTAPEFRPPWALAEDQFLDRCNRCGDCLAACPRHLLSPGGGGFPVIGFARGGCDFCGACATACKPAALARREGAVLPLLAAVAASCLSAAGTHCRVCGDWCEAAALRFRPLVGGRAQVEIDGGRCTGCGACVARCPATALTMLHRPAKELAACA